MTTRPTNILIPFRRDKKRDFASGSGEALPPWPKFQHHWSAWIV